MYGDQFGEFVCRYWGLGLICQMQATFPATSFPGFSPTHTTPIGRVGENPGNEVAFPGVEFLRILFKFKKRKEHSSSYVHVLHKMSN